MAANEEQKCVAEPQAKKLKDDDAEKHKNPGETQPNPLSKNQIKKQKKLAEYERIKKERRLRERERQKEKRQEAIAKGLPARTGPSRKELKKRQTMTTASDGTAALQVAIDLDYDELMKERDVAKCVKQCLRIYTINRRSSAPVKLHFTGIKSEGRIHAAFRKNDGWENWHVNYQFDRPHTVAFAREELIYLTCESDTVLERLEAGRVYVIGGLVDHNHQKGLCHERATAAGLRTARLPLNEHVDMKTRSVLSTFHVFEILVRLAEGKSWTEAILETIPMRKGAKAKTQSPDELNANQITPKQPEEAQMVDESKVINEKIDAQHKIEDDTKEEDTKEEDTKEEDTKEEDAKEEDTKEETAPTTS